MIKEWPPIRLSAAADICPELKYSSGGIYQKGIWTEYVDKKCLLSKDMLQGINLDNYGSWLNWTYLVMSSADRINPVTENAKDLNAVTGGEIKMPWLMSFGEKGFQVDNCVVNDKGMLFKKSMMGSQRLERECIPDRFGKKVVLERIYDGHGQLEEICMVFRDRDGIILKIDDPTMWGYQFPQMCSQFLINDRIRIYNLARGSKPLAKAALRGGYARSRYTGEIIKGT